MSEKREPKGLTILGATSFMNGCTHGPDGCSEAELHSDPLFVVAEDVDRYIQDGAWTAGHLDNVKVLPPREEWPDRWKGLQKAELASTFRVTCSPGWDAYPGRAGA